MDFSNIEFTSTHVEDTNRFRYIMVSVYIAIMCFFLLLVSISSIDANKSTEITSELRRKFSFDYVEPPFKNENNIKTSGPYQDLLTELNSKLIKIGITPYKFNNNSFQFELTPDFVKTQRFYDEILSILKKYPANANIIISVPYTVDTYEYTLQSAQELAANANSYVKQPEYIFIPSIFLNKSLNNNIKITFSNEPRL